MAKMDRPHFKGPLFKLTVCREEDAQAAKEEFRKDVIEGLSKPQKSISSKYFYDDRGSGKFVEWLLGLESTYAL